MADEFTGVPDREWWRTWRDAAFGRLFAEVALFVLALLIVTLVSKGVLSWTDFLPSAHE